ncbi:hypothetical protein [Catenuloplanes indicus]|uniref:Uncharacterized protein n=1 Tax=Catenuloplanes indicus TaxID=137267 RepID=A0AAE4AY79_9ACTN|nr:hypothetical protein [Catenuloplanes indicus]MDQ0367845.1 hypothetical protein [Catenuloplanes indicus]
MEPVHWGRDKSLWIEYAIVTAVAIPLAQWQPISNFLHELFKGRRGDIYPAIVGLEGVVLGFVVAALTIVLGYANSPRFELIKGTKNYAAIFRAYIRAAKWMALALTYGMAALIFDTDEGPNSPLCFLLFATLTLACIRFGRVIYITEKVVKVVVNSHSRAPGA